MLDFLMVSDRYYPKKHLIEIYPKFIIKTRSSDLMIRGGDFYAIYNEETGLWSTNEEDVITQVDKELKEYRKHVKLHSDEDTVTTSYMWDSDSGTIDKWHKYVQKQLRDRYHQLDEKIIFSNTETNKEDYASKRLPYPLEECSIDSYDELISTLYSEKERDKLEWAIGSIIAGDSKKIQKFIVLYGSAGSGKSTVLNIIQMLFDGYYTTFDAKSLGSSNNSFALESFKDNPLIGIQHDGDLSRIEDNTKLNSIISHETMEINEKFKSKYAAKFNTFLFIGTNKPVRITEAKSGLIRRLIDVTPSGNKVSFKRYSALMKGISHELGGIAHHCLNKYLSMGETYYDKYVPRDMISATNDFYDFVENYYDDFKNQDAVTLKDAWSLYTKYCEYANIKYPYSMRAVRVELQNYFKDYREQTIIHGKHYRNYYSGFIKEKFLYETGEIVEEEESSWLVMDKDESIFDELFKDYPAQLANNQDKPKKKWDDVTTVLSDVDTSKTHYVLPPSDLIVVDFDLKDETGKKSKELNLKAAEKWPKTYAEYSNGGEGIHLSYFYTGDVSDLSNIFAEDIEVKKFTGKSSLRRRLSMCNDIPIATINSGLPLKGGKKVIDFKAAESEKQLRKWIEKCLNKEHHGATKPEVDFINKILDDAYNDGLKYDVRDLRPMILAFANNSTNQSDTCIKIVNGMKFHSDEGAESKTDDGEMVFFDVEVFPNFFGVVWKKETGPPVKMINPTPLEVEEILPYKLVGFNCRRYDNHILYARMMGYDNAQLYKLSQKIINGSPNSTFANAYGLSYADVYDFSSKKQSLKKFEIELGIHHQELGLRWDQNVPDELVDLVMDYCVNDVVATQAVFEARKQDFVAREVLADLSGLTVNDTTQKHTAKIIFGDDKSPQHEFVYTDLSEMFPGYTFDAGKSSYKGEDPGEGGYVYARPGMYGNVALLDIASMHPTSLIELNLFGSYTKNFKELLDARIAIKHRDYDKAKKMLNGTLGKYLGSDEDADALQYALKIVINSVYGLTSASFNSPFKDPRNKDNIVAKRGALFMIDLKEEVQKRGYCVAHIKTDSIKIPDADKKIIEFVCEFGKKYGYTFEHEATYDKLCLVNDAVYVAREKTDKGLGKWTATGTQFQVPYVFKTLFSKEPIEFKDLCETKTVTSALYLDMNENLPDVSKQELELKKLFGSVKNEQEVRSMMLEMNNDSDKAIDKDLLDKIHRMENLDCEIAKGHDYRFVGKAGSFCPIKSGKGGGLLMREKDGKYFAATGTKGYRWLEAEEVVDKKKEEDIDHSYYIALVDEAKETIEQYYDFEWFVSDDPYNGFELDIPF